MNQIEILGKDAFDSVHILRQISESMGKKSKSRLSKWVGIENIDERIKAIKKDTLTNQ